MYISPKYLFLVILAIGILSLLAGCHVASDAGLGVLPINTPTSIQPQNPRPAVAPTVTPTPVVLPDGRSQRSFPEEGFTLSYPSNATFSTGRAKGELYNTITLQFALPATQGYQGMTIRVESNPDNLSIEQIIANMYERMTLLSSPPSLASHIESIKVAGKQAYKTDIFLDNSAFYIFLRDNNKVYIFALVHGLTSSGSSPEAERLFNEVMSTLILD